MFLEKKSTQRTPSIGEKKLADRAAKLVKDSQRTDGGSIKDTDLQKWIAPPVSWGYQRLMDIAVTRFQDFIRLTGPDEPQILVKDPEQYFRRSVHHLSLELMKIFVLYLARTSAGMLDDHITSTTVRGYLVHTLGAFHRCLGIKQLQGDEIHQVYTYIKQYGNQRVQNIFGSDRLHPRLAGKFPVFFQLFVAIVIITVTII